MAAAVAEKPKAEAADQASEQLAARVRAVDAGQTVSGKDVAAWDDGMRKAVAALLDKPPRCPWDVHEKYPEAVVALGKTKAERLVAGVIAKRLEGYERQRTELDEAFDARRDAEQYVAEKKSEASDANKAYSDAKEELEAAERLIIALAANKKNGQIPLPMEIPKNGKPAAQANGKPASNGQAKPAKPAKGGDPADTAPIESLNLGKRITEGMHAADLKTVGGLIAFIKTDEWWHRKIKGVGESAIDKVTDALNDWRLKNPVAA